MITESTRVKHLVAYRLLKQSLAKNLPSTDKKTPVLFLQNNGRMIRKTDRTLVIYNLIVVVHEGVASINIFLSRLSNSTTLSELEKTARSLLTKKIHLPFTEPPTLHSCKIMKIKDAHNGVELHGLLHIKPDSAAKWFIKSCAL